MRQNITLSVDRDLLKRIRGFAAAKGKSISALMADELQHIVEDDEAYRQAMAAAVAQMDEGLDLDATGIGNRERAHDRQDIR
jgi:predicted transcriptional regulator